MGTPRRHRVASWGRRALASPVRMIDRVHRGAADRRPDALPPPAPRLAGSEVLVLGVADLAHGGPAAPSEACASRPRASAGWRSRLPWPSPGPKCRQSGRSGRSAALVSSMLCTTVPTGMLRNGRALPTRCRPRDPTRRWRPRQGGRAPGYSASPRPRRRPRRYGSCGWGRTRSKLPDRARRPCRA